ncbi:hypothetical protein [Bacillus sp. NPDC093026]|uniref:hypothetical protein n=1 Tax=Bacillus sp. NPDC093026 TaxID=3363948 RepID=UPI00381E87E2
MVTLQPMSQSDEASLMEASIKRYAEKEEALENAEDQFNSLLPNGIHTENHELLNL